MKTILRVLFSNNVGRIILFGSSATIMISIGAALSGYDSLLYAAYGLTTMIGYIVAAIKYIEFEDRNVVPLNDDSVVEEKET